MSAPAYPIPIVALDDRLAFIGTSGSGKTYGAGTAAEKLLSTGAKVVIVDPLGVWWGLRLNADGKSPGFELPIFGGPHGDLPLNDSAGKLIGETVASMRESCIVDLSGLQTKEAERRFMLAFLDALYRHAAGDPMHAIFDEADLWAPQNPSKQGVGPQLQSLMEQIVRRGRVRGFIPWLITQRPAVISKDVLSQADGLVAFKLTASQDRKAIGDWVRGQADEGQWPVMDSELPRLQRGEALVWLPGHGKLELSLFPVKATFDSSQTPKRGEKKQRRDLKPLDLEGLKDRLASIEKEAKANDPRALKAEIARLIRELAVAQKSAAPAWPDQREEVRQLRNEVSDLRGYTKLVDEKLAKIKDLATMDSDRCLLTEKPTRIVREGCKEDGITPGDPLPVKWGGLTRPRPRTDSSQIRAKVAQPSDGSIPAGCAKPLAALAGVYPSGMTEAQWALAAGYKRTGGTWGTYKSRLRQAGLIEQRGREWFATEIGANAVGEVEQPPAPGPDLVRWWAGKLPGTARIAEALISAHPQVLTKDELADRVGMTASGGSFGTYLSRLASPGVIVRTGGLVQLAPEVMGS